MIGMETMLEHGMNYKENYEKTINTFTMFNLAFLGIIHRSENAAADCWWADGGGWW